MRHANLADLADGMSLHGLAVDENLAALNFVHAGDHLGDLALTVALDAGNAKDLTTAHTEGNIGQNLLAEVVVVVQLLHL